MNNIIFAAARPNPSSKKKKKGWSALHTTVLFLFIFYGLPNLTFAVGGWEKWEVLDTPGGKYPNVINDPAVLAYGKDLINLIVLNKDRNLYHTYSTDGANSFTQWWLDLESPGDNGIIESAPGVVCLEKGRIDIFVIATNPGTKHVGLWRKIWAVDKKRWHWRSWESINIVKGFEPKLTSAPAPVSRKEGWLGIFIRGKEGKMWHNYSFDGGATWLDKWIDRGGELTSAPAAISPRYNRVYCFVKDKDHKLSYRRLKDGAGGWGEGWKKIGSPNNIALASAPSVCSWGPDRIDVFVTCEDGNLWHIYTEDDSTTWSKWEDLGQPQNKSLIYAPAAVSPGPKRIECFVLDEDHKIGESGIMGTKKNI